MLSRERLQERFIEMVKIYSPSKGEKEMADWLENWLSARKIPFQSDRAGEQYGGNGRNIVACLKGAGDGIPLGFGAHMDQIEPCANVQPIVEGSIIRTDGTTTLPAAANPPSTKRGLLSAPGRCSSRRSTRARGWR